MTGTTTAAVAVRRFPTKLHLRCRGCLHEGVAQIFLEQVQRLRCKRCGSRNIAVLARDRLAAWSTRRRGR
jgi:Zn finger protein HypA/HybF involved in hydrogenase expression